MAFDLSIEQRFRRLRIWNIVVGLILAVQAAVIAVLTNDFSLPVIGTFMEGPPGTAPGMQELFSIPTGWGVFAFLAISAGALLIIASPPVFPWYKRNLLQNRNYGRWIEYFFSSSDHDRADLSDLRHQRYRCAAGHIRHQRLHDPLRGCMEKYEEPGKANWLSFWFGCFAGIIPWIAIVVYIWAPGHRRVAARVRLWHHRFAVRLLQLLRRQHGAAVQEGGSLAGLPVRGEGLHHPQPHGEGTAGVAGVLCGADRG